MSITKNIFAPWASGLGATRRAAMLLLVMMLTMTAQTAWAQDAISGLTYNAAGGYYEINDAQDLVDLATYVNSGNNASGKTFKQTHDINMSSIGNLEPIGSQPKSYNTSFNGTYDGQGNAIIGLTVNTSSPYAGLFGKVQGGSVRNVTMVNPHITSNDNSVGMKYAGGIVGIIKPGTIENCNVINQNSNVIDPMLNTHSGNGLDYQGAICGGITMSTGSAITNCYYYTATEYVAVEDNRVGVSVTASRTYTLTLADDATTNTAPAFSYGGTGYYTGTITLAAAPTGWVYEYSVNGSPISGNTFDISADATVSFTAHLSPLLGWTESYTPDGSSERPYIISSEAGWNLFCDLLADNDKGYFTGKTVKLGADITVSRMAGCSYHDFTGTFDGDGHTLTFSHTTSDNYCAPFRYVQGVSTESPAVIRNLNVVSTITAADYRHIAGLIALQSGYVAVTNCNIEANISCTKGTNNPIDLYPAGLVSQSNDAAGSLTVSGCTISGQIATDGKYAAGLIGIVQKSATIENCLVSVTINSSTSGDGTHGGLVASQPSKTTIDITGCMFDGRLLGSSTTSCGGFIGWRSGTATVTNSLFAPAEVTVQNASSATFARNTTDTYNSYYTYLLNDGTNYVPNLYDDTVSPAKWRNGKACHSVTAGENVTIDAIALTGDATEYNVSGITAYSGGGLKRGDVKYYGSGDQVSLTLSNTTTGAPEGYTNGGYTASAGTLSGTENPYTLTMPDEDVTITVTLKKLMTNNDITVTIPSQTWTGNELTPVITVKDGETVLTLDEDYTVTAPSGPVQDSGNHAYTITGMGNYSDSREATFTITPFLADQFGAVYVYEDQNGMTALLDGTSVDPVDIDFNHNIIVNHVTSNRVFTPGMASTVMLPFNYTCNGEEGGTFYKFVDVKQVNDKWVATMQETGNDANNEGTLIANTPYLFMPTATEMTFPNINGSVTLSTEGGGNCETAAPGSHWTFKGTYWFKEWNSNNYYDAEEIGRAYGFAGVAKDGINVGDFVRVDNGAKIRPMRAYLLWNDMPNAANARSFTRGAAATDEELPQSITVRLVGSNGETTGIGTINTKTGEMTFDSEAWYTLDGVRLSGKPTKKGLYINNGRKVVIK